MKKLTLSLFILFVVGFTSAAFGQTTTDTAKFVYCELVGEQKLLSRKVSVSVDYGDEAGYFKDTRMRDEETGKVKNFNSMVDALNYMGNQGWEFVQAYIVTAGQQNVYHWLLKKKK